MELVAGSEAICSERTPRARRRPQQAVAPVVEVEMSRVATFVPVVFKRDEKDVSADRPPEE